MCSCYLESFLQAPVQKRRSVTLGTRNGLTSKPLKGQRLPHKLEYMSLIPRKAKPDDQAVPMCGRCFAIVTHSCCHFYGTVAKYLT